MSNLDDDPETIAKERGQEIVLSDERHLQLDLDECDVRDETLNRLVTEGIVERTILRTTSRSGNSHLYVMLKEPIRSKALRIALQVMLGSDPTRELLSLLRLVKSSTRPAILLFESAEEAGRARRFLEGEPAKTEFEDDDVPF